MAYIHLFYTYTYPTRLTLWRIFENHDWFMFESITRVRQVVYIHIYVYVLGIGEADIIILLLYYVASS